MNAGFEQLVADAPYGRVEQLSPLVRRVLARNPSPFTFTGTGTYIVGRGEVAIIDPGPADPAHVEAVAAAVAEAGERVRFHLITHTHLDHSPAARPLQALVGGAIGGCAPLALADDGPRADAGFDPDYAPDFVLADGEAVEGPGWRLTAVATPGHTSNHLCYALAGEGALFTGDHVMGWSTTVVAPPDGDMAAYLASLEKLANRQADRIYYPTHGEPVTEPQRWARHLAAHRRQREAQILAELEAGPRAIPALVERLYAQVDRRLWGAAGRSVLAHLIDLEARGRVTRSGADAWRLQ